jgi:hypothetical protein
MCLVCPCAMPETCINLRSWLVRARAAMMGSDGTHIGQLVVVLDAGNESPPPPLTPDHHRVLNPAHLWPHQDPW